MPKNLLIVESPAKAKTIEKFLGKDFTVKSSYGHVSDLPKGELAVDIAHHFQPKYVISPNKQKVVKELKETVKKVDEDREGEAISWHLCRVLGLDEHTTKRIVFHEITQPAIQQAIKVPRKLDLNLVNAQQARRVLDRLVGYELSELLWKKVKGKLSAGRVQSVAVRLIVEREREILAFEPKAYFKVSALFEVAAADGRTVLLKADSPVQFETADAASAFLEGCKGATYRIGEIEVKPSVRRPAAPFTTSTLQQEASRKLGFSVSRTMSVAQRLYESGHITYMRTDSTNLSELALSAIAQEIEQQFGPQYLHTRRYKTKKAGAQEAHEAIRPTYITQVHVSGDRDQQRLYELIWKRTIASQMSDARLERTLVKISISTQPTVPLQAEGEVLIFDGFLKVYLESRDEEEDEAKGMLPPLKEGQSLQLGSLTATERTSRPPARYTEAGLVSALEELGIGRPSTYAPTITKIMEENRGYVVKDSREGVPRSFRVLTLSQDKLTQRTETEMSGAVKNRLFPTDMGMVVTDFLTEHFQGIMDFGFTAGIEAQFDQIAEGSMLWEDMVGHFYFPFHRQVDLVRETGVRATGERILGKDPATGRTVLVRMTRFGKPAVQIGSQDELAGDEKPRFANLSPGQSLESITLEQALRLFELPRSLGEHLGKEVVATVGRFGPYLKFGELSVTLPKGVDPLSLELPEAIELIREKLQADAPIGTYQGLPITKGSGRFGPFLKWNGMYVNIPKKFSLDKITVDEAIGLIGAKVEKEANRYIKRWEKEEISIENGRWGPFIRYKKNSITLPKVNGAKPSAEEAASLSLEDVKDIIREAVPGAFKK
jgi:DNA topoisomerase-1